MISATTQPNIYSCGYSAVPLRLTDSNVDLVDNYKYVINIIYDKLTISTASSVNFDNYIYTKLTYSTPHKYSVGDVLFLNDSADIYTDYYIVKQIDVNNTSVIIDLTLSQAIVGAATTAKVIPYKKSPDPDGEAKTDIGNTLKDYVTQDLIDTSFIYPGDNTRFNYEVVCGYESKAVFQFNDDIFGLSGNTAFINTGLTSVNQVDFEIGDEIIVERNLADWNYYDNFFDAGNLGFTSLTETHNFQVGDTITITGQITFPSYNGVTTVMSVPDAYSLVTNKTFLGSTGVEGGTIYGVVNPSYNTTTTIKNIYFITTPVSGVCIETFINWGISTLPIAGTIKHRDGRLIQKYNGLTISGKSVFNSYVSDYNYEINYMDKYVVKSGSAALNNFSTILNTYVTGEKYRIEKSTKSWLLQHNATTAITDSVLYTWKNNNTILGTSYILNSQSSNLLDFYVPIGVDEILLNTGRTDSTPLSSIYSSITNYDVTATSNSGTTATTNSISFEINEDCAGYDLYHLMWKDALGSWISYPFKYISSNSTSVDRKNYYQTSGNWDNSTFGYENYDKGDTTFFARSRDMVVINSGWIEEYENALIKDLMQSAAVYIQTPDNVLFAATIQNKDIKFGSLQNEKVWQYEFTVMYANNEIRL
jgi:hypothetical protein